MSIVVTYVRSKQPDLTNMQVAILLMVYMTPGPHYVAELAGHLQSPKSSISKAVLRLESLGYLQQAPDLYQRRRNRILPTEAGSAFLDGLKAAVEPVLKTSASKAQLRGLIRDLDLVGDGFRAAFPLPEGDAFSDLLLAIDNAA